MQTIQCSAASPATQSYRKYSGRNTRCSCLLFRGVVDEDDDDDDDDDDDIIDGAMQFLEQSRIEGLGFCPHRCWFQVRLELTFDPILG